jgi:hypothetical protein
MNKIHYLNNKIIFKNMFSASKIPRNIDKVKLYEILDKNMFISMEDTISDCFYIRDHRNGRGERKLGRLCFSWLANRHPTIFLKVFHHIPIYGRWDDLLYIDNPRMYVYIYEFIKILLHRDYLNMSIG